MKFYKNIIFHGKNVQFYVERRKGTCCRPRGPFLPFNNIQGWKFESKNVKIITKSAKIGKYYPNLPHSTEITNMHHKVASDWKGMGGGGPPKETPSP